jgi:signal peptidase I
MKSSEWRELVVELLEAMLITQEDIMERINMTDIAIPLSNPCKTLHKDLCEKLLESDLYDLRSEEFEIPEQLILNEGDMFILNVSEGTSPKHFDEITKFIHKKLTEVFGFNVPVMVLPANMSYDVIKKGEHNTFKDPELRIQPYKVPTNLVEEFWLLVSPYRDKLNGFANTNPITAMLKKARETLSPKFHSIVKNDVCKYFDLVERLGSDFRKYMSNGQEDPNTIPTIEVKVGTFPITLNKESLAKRVEALEKEFIVRNVAMGDSSGIWIQKSSPMEMFNLAVINNYKHCEMFYKYMERGFNV